MIERSSIDALFAAHGVRGAWVPLPTTGLANLVFATDQVVLRVATDHPDAEPDARTESVAAPAAHAAGIRTPRLLAWDDSRTLIDRPFSLSERVDGVTLGSLEPAQAAGAWRQVGRELARLHRLITACDDPRSYLDTPGRETDGEVLLRALLDGGLIADAGSDQIERLIGELATHVAAAPANRFLHNDVHAANVLCSPAGELVALIDWGDAGWGDPALEFAAIAFDALPHALDGYRSETPTYLGEFPEARFVWDKLWLAVEDGVPLRLGDLQRALSGRC